MNKTYIHPFSYGAFSFNGAFCFEKNEKAFLLSEQGTSIILSGELLQSILHKCISDEMKIKLINRGFAKTENSPTIKPMGNEVLPTFFLVSLTNNCNLRCKYCFNKFVDFKYIDNDVIDDIICYLEEYFMEYKPKGITIQLWGGEPLTRFDKIEYFYNRIKETEIIFKLCIETNGTLISKEIAEKLHSMSIDIGVSFDGCPSIQDFQRPKANGKKSSEDALNGIRNLKTYYRHLGSISVVTKKLLEHFDESFDFITSSGLFNSIKFNIVKLGKDNKLSLRDEEIEIYASKLVDKAFEVFNTKNQITEGNIIERLKNLVYRPCGNICVSHGCQGGRKMISFDAVGNIYPCEMTDYDDVRMGSIYDDKDLVKLIKRNAGQKYFAEKNLLKCKDCPFLFYCRGGCTSAIIYKKGVVEGIDEEQCIMNKIMYPKLIEKILDEPNTVSKMIGDYNL